MSEPALQPGADVTPLTPLSVLPLSGDGAGALPAGPVTAGSGALGIPLGGRPKPPGAASDDELSPYTPAEVAAWYRRLANLIKKKQGDSLAALMLLHWLDGKGAKLTFPHARVERLSFVVEHLRSEVRPVFLTERKAKLKGGEKWAGVLPRIKKMPGFPPWDGTSPIPMEFTGQSVGVPLSVQAKAALGLATDPDELDVLMSLHTFGLKSNVIVTATPVPKTPNYTIKFTSWKTHAFDRYDWDPTKHLTVPNPDFGNPDKVADPIAPAKDTIRVYHSNAKRVEAAGLAAPYDAESTEWTPADPDTVKDALVDASRSLT